MADSILIWNEIALRANQVSHTDRDKGQQQGPTLSSRALAIVHLAMYDAYAAVRGNPADLPPYLPGLPPAPPGATPQAAVAAAAHRALSSLFPAQASDFDQDFAQHGGPPNPGHAFGVAVADALLADRSGDPDASDAGYTASNARFRHRPDPDNPGQGYHAPFYGAGSKGFAITARHELRSPAKGQRRLPASAAAGAAEGDSPRAGRNASSLARR